jgi:hypothetical protein
MHDTRVTLVTLRHSIFCLHLSWPGFVEPEMETKRIGEAANKTIFRIWLELVHALYSPD